MNSPGMPRMPRNRLPKRTSSVENAPFFKAQGRFA